MITKTTLSYPDEPNNRRYRFEIKSITCKMTHLEKNQYRKTNIRKKEFTWEEFYERWKLKWRRNYHTNKQNTPKDSLGNKTELNH